MPGNVLAHSLASFLFSALLFAFADHEEKSKYEKEKTYCSSNTIQNKFENNVMDR